jgi:hypothetical protein
MQYQLSDIDVQLESIASYVMPVRLLQPVEIIYSLHDWQEI